LISSFPLVGGKLGPCLVWYTQRIAHAQGNTNKILSAEIFYESHHLCIHLDHFTSPVPRNLSALSRNCKIWKCFLIFDFEKFYILSWLKIRATNRATNSTSCVYIFYFRWRQCGTNIIFYNCYPSIIMKLTCSICACII